ncbi:MAG: hypothetical protein ABIG28_01610 [archaeon]
MMGYNDLYEILRKEKYSESLQPLPKKFIEDFKEYLNETAEEPSPQSTLFSNSIEKSRKQRENSISMFRELILKRKRKILNLVFIATETGIMKRDYENMLEIEKQTFDSLVKTFEQGDKELSKILTAKTAQEKTAEEKNKMILFKQNIDQFIDHEGKTVGPFKSGDLANLNSNIAQILVSDDKASFIDEPQ